MNPEIKIFLEIWNLVNCGNSTIIQGCQVPTGLHGHITLSSRPLGDLSRPQNFLPRPFLRPLLQLLIVLILVNKNVILKNPFFKRHSHTKSGYTVVNVISECHRQKIRTVNTFQKSDDCPLNSYDASTLIPIK
jgi:hypothetical protein